jgi:hypothetical protein
MNNFSPSHAWGGFFFLPPTTADHFADVGKMVSIVLIIGQCFWGVKKCVEMFEQPFYNEITK